jgi:hypothetical protein
MPAHGDTGHETPIELDGDLETAEFENVLIDIRNPL